MSGMITGRSETTACLCVEDGGCLAVSKNERTVSEGGESEVEMGTREGVEYASWPADVHGHGTCHPSVITIDSSTFKMQHTDARELNKAPFKEEMEALRVTLGREERLMNVLAEEISRVQIEHDVASHAFAQAQAELDAASVVYRTSDAMLQGLLKQYHQLLQNVAQKKAALHPIRRVPAELWKDVFTFLASDQEYDHLQRLDTKLPIEHQTPASLTVASVSSFWRKTALSTPTLVRASSSRLPVSLTNYDASGDTLPSRTAPCPKSKPIYRSGQRDPLLVPFLCACGTSAEKAGRKSKPFRPPLTVFE